MESANYEYIEFWLLDPYLEDETAEGGDLYFNLGEISEDILKDERKFFENGMPVDGDMSKVDTTVWGKVPRTQSTGYAFDAQNRELQDVGLNGLSTEEEQTFPTYADYLNKLRAKLSGETISKMMDDPFSPFNDPAGDNYHYFRLCPANCRQLVRLSGLRIKWLSQKPQTKLLKRFSSSVFSPFFICFYYNRSTELFSSRRGIFIDKNR